MNDSSTKTGIIIFIPDLRVSFENRNGEGSLTSFEMTGIVIPSRREESFPSIFILVGERGLMNHFVVKARLANSVALVP
jgi:hypothetical protein